LSADLWSSGSPTRNKAHQLANKSLSSALYGIYTHLEAPN
jgi:hypothetical protein